MQTIQLRAIEFTYGDFFGHLGDMLKQPAFQSTDHGNTPGAAGTGTRFILGFVLFVQV